MAVSVWVSFSLKSKVYIVGHNVPDLWQKQIVDCKHDHGYCGSNVPDKYHGGC